MVSSISRFRFHFFQNLQKVVPVFGPIFSLFSHIFPLCVQKPGKTGLKRTFWPPPGPVFSWIKGAISIFRPFSGAFHQWKVRFWVAFSSIQKGFEPVSGGPAAYFMVKMVSLTMK